MLSGTSATTSTSIDVFVGETRPPTVPLTDGDGRPNQGADGFPTTDNAPQPTLKTDMAFGARVSVSRTLLRLWWQGGNSSRVCPGSLALLRARTANTRRRGLAAHEVFVNTVRQGRNDKSVQQSAGSETKTIRQGEG